jgi:cytochrome c oxidase cbb3-type subunit 3
MKPGCRIHFFVTATLLVWGAVAWAAESTDPKADEAKAADVRDAEILTAAKKASILKSGKATYAQLCQNCHADEKAKGDSPSNLFDTKWYHGSRPSEIDKTVQNGVLEKGMPPWGPVLPPEDVTAVVAFILSQQKSS